MIDISMEMDTTDSTPVAKPSMPIMPENIWLDIFGYLALEEKFKVSR